MSKQSKAKTSAKGTHPVNPPFENDAQAIAAAVDGTEEAPKPPTNDVVQPPFDNDYEAMRAATSGEKDRRAAKASVPDVVQPPFETDAQAQAYATNPENKKHDYVQPPFPGTNWAEQPTNDVVAYYNKVHPGAQKEQKVAPNTVVPESKDTLKEGTSHGERSKSS